MKKKIRKAVSIRKVDDTFNNPRQRTGNKR